MTGAEARRIVQIKPERILIFEGDVPIAIDLKGFIAVVSAGVPGQVRQCDFGEIRM
jgi:hypothetical protein